MNNCHARLILFKSPDVCFLEVEIFVYLWTLNGYTYKKG